MNEQDTIFTTHVGPEGAPAVGTRMAITEGRSPADPPRATDAAADPSGAWVVTRVDSLDMDGAIDVYLARVTEGTA
jgi:hypothetical protein